MNNNFERCFSIVIMKEGGYSNNPYDSGGETMFGITKETARRNGYLGKMKDLTLDFAKKIYKKDYWDSIKLDSINNFDIQLEMFDTAVNCGLKNAVKNFQKSFNIAVALDNTNKLIVDGVIGNNTINALNTFKKQDRLVMFANAYQVKYYLEITEANPKNSTFIYGWLKNRIKI